MSATAVAERSAVLLVEFQNPWTLRGPHHRLIRGLSLPDIPSGKHIEAWTSATRVARPCIVAHAAVASRTAGAERIRPWAWHLEIAPTRIAKVALAAASSGGYAALLGSPGPSIRWNDAGRRRAKFT